jgi:heat shock protein HslJ
MKANGRPRYMNLTHLTRAALALGIVLAAVSCGDDSTQASSELENTTWLIEAVVDGDRSEDPPDGPLLLEFLQPTRVLMDLGCNTASGEYGADDAGNFDAEALAWTEMGCVGTEDWFLLADAMEGATSWSIDDGYLELAGPTLTIRAAATDNLPVFESEPDAPAG